LMATAAEYGFKYRENRTVAAAFASHLRMLRLLGQPGAGMEAAAPAREGEVISA
ncbi:MAG: hypothetical protein RLZZ165_99, partial [Bacteroidota bacterium]